MAFDRFYHTNSAVSLPKTVKTLWKQPGLATIIAHHGVFWRNMMLNTLPTYEVEFIPVERRMGDRRANPNAGLPRGVTEDRRKGGRRETQAAQANQRSV